MEKILLSADAQRLMVQAIESHSGRSAVTVYGGKEHRLRQTLIAICVGQQLAEHSSPGEATLQVLQGHVSLQIEGEALEASTGELLIIPDAKHSVSALADSVMLLTVSK